MQKFISWQPTAERNGDFYDSKVMSILNCSKADIEKLLASSGDFQNATVTIEGFEPTTDSLGQVTSNNATVKYSGNLDYFI